jgi:hypothetical protein
MPGSRQARRLFFFYTLYYSRTKKKTSDSSLYSLDLHIFNSICLSLLFFSFCYFLFGCIIRRQPGARRTWWWCMCTRCVNRCATEFGKKKILLSPRSSLFAVSRWTQFVLSLSFILLINLKYEKTRFAWRDNWIYSPPRVYVWPIIHTQVLYFLPFFFRDKHETLGNTQMADKEGGQRRKIQTSRAAQLNETVGPVRPHPWHP